MVHPFAERPGLSRTPPPGGSEPSRLAEITSGCPACHRRGTLVSRTWECALCIRARRSRKLVEASSVSGETAREIELGEHPPGEVTPRQRHGGGRILGWWRDELPGCSSHHVDIEPRAAGRGAARPRPRQPGDSDRPRARPGTRLSARVSLRPPHHRDEPAPVEAHPGGHHPASPTARGLPQVPQHLDG